MNTYQCGQVRGGMLKQSNNYTVNYGGNIYHFIYRFYIRFAV